MDDQQAVIEISDLTKRYSGRSGTITAVDDVSLTIGDDGIVGLLGPNGAGKTTLIKTILGLLRPTSGRVTVDGIDVHENQRATYHHISAVLEGARNTYWRLSVMENLRFFSALQGRSPAEQRDRFEELLTTFDLQAKRDEPVRSLSRGMQQKVSLAATLARETPFLFLDEPTLGLDVETTEELKGELRGLAANDRTVVLSSHDMSLVEELCDRIIVIDEGSVVVDDSVDELLGLFETRQIEFTIAGLTDGEQARLDQRFAVDEWDRRAEGVHCVVPAAADADGAFTRAVLDCDAVVERKSPVEPSLKDAFMRIAAGEYDRAEQVASHDDAGQVVTR